MYGPPSSARAASQPPPTARTFRLNPSWVELYRTPLTRPRYVLTLAAFPTAPYPPSPHRSIAGTHVTQAVNMCIPVHQRSPNTSQRLLFQSGRHDHPPPPPPNHCGFARQRRHRRRPLPPLAAARRLQYYRHRHRHRCQRCHARGSCSPYVQPAMSRIRQSPPDRGSRDRRL